MRADASNDSAAAPIFALLGLAVFERGWLSSNTIAFKADRRAPASLVDTGYCKHADQLLGIADRLIPAGQSLRIVNTHLHSDHCGGNAALAGRWSSEIVVPAASFDVVRDWNDSRLTFELTGQSCPRFAASDGLADGDRVHLGGYAWQAFSTGGHDPDAMVLWQPDARVLISGDALWERGLAINFPELGGDRGFGAARESLSLIERLEPQWVIPGHGRPFADVAAALAWSRLRLDAFEREPRLHFAHAARALTMFHMLEHRCRARRDVLQWLATTPVFSLAHQALSHAGESVTETASHVVDGLLEARHLSLDAATDELRLSGTK